ncbi:MAG TPA: hypothetical protein VM097_10565 [Mycobacteriales bacterium]|nr:hypothetical protein [Mycobacteriales bacterium]
MRRRLLAAVLLVGIGRLLSPDAVPVYDGIGAPDEPYRFVAPPSGAKKTADPTSARATSPVVAGVSSYGLSVATAESGPQFSLFVPPRSVATGGPTLRVEVAPLAPSDQPPGARIDGNVYGVTLTGAGPVTLTPQAALATLYLRATTAAQPPPKMQYRPAAADPWQALDTARAGQDVYVSDFRGPGQYALAFAASAAEHRTSRLPYLVGGALVLVVVVVVVVRLRATA